MKRCIRFISFIVLAISCSPNVEPDVLEPTEVAVQAIEISSTTLSMQPGNVVTLTARVIPADASNQKLTWSSSDEVVATVSQSGEVTALTEGNCTITVGCEDKKAECVVTVNMPIVPVSSVSVSSTSESLLVGETTQLTAKVLPEDATDKTVIWATSDENIATVDNGLITALSVGEATITATAGECSAICTVNVLAPFSYGGMCLEAVTDGTISVSNPNRLVVEYKVENSDWFSSDNADIIINAQAGERVWFRGQNETYTAGDPQNSFTSFNCDGGKFYLYGNLMSMIYGDDFEGKTEIVGEYTFYKMFIQNANIINHPTLDIELPATTLSPSCYRNMFYKCTNLTRAPKLPAKVLTEACYASMFAYCTSIKVFPEMAATDMADMSCTWMMMASGIEEAPELPATNLADACYEYMFVECPNLKKAMSVLPATELAPFCYTGMFQRSDKLENAPELPATVLTYSCYSHMFNGCKALTKAPTLPAMSLAEACYQRMFGNSGLTEAPELPAMNMDVFCYQHMFQNCTELEKAPVLPALQLVYYCYENMFNGCEKLNYIKAEFLTKPSDSYTRNWVEGVATTGTFVKNPDVTWDVRGVNGVPEGWTIE